MTTLDGQWTLRAVGGPVPDDLAGRVVPATVPGTVHTDLLAAGLIPDPFDGDNERALAWIGRCDWEYSREFDVDLHAAERHDLVCDGLDTVATVRVNGADVARTANQHRRYRFDLRPFLRHGGNTLSIRFDSAIDEAERMEAVYGELPHSYRHPFNALRKSASNFGWDWGIEAVTAGIWRSIRLESWSDVRITSLMTAPDLEGTTGRLVVSAGIEWATAAPAELTVRVDGSSITVPLRPKTPRAEVVLEVPDVEPWWPIGHGGQRLYQATVTLSTGSTHDVHSRAVGFRSVRLDSSADAHGTGFTLVVNERPIYIRGANWIPDDAFVTRVTPERYADRIADATDANVNLLRIWGGGIYEDDAFYARCDEVGVLVWQDFLFACAAYTESEPLRGEIEQEATDAITRLSAHPSLVLWNGNNENIWGYVDWGWRPRLAGQSWGEGYYIGLLADLVERLDGTRPYSPGSPFSFDRYIHPNDPSHGTTHIWDVWNERDYSAYGEYSPRFVSEFGFQGPPAWSTLTRVVHDEPLSPYGPQMLVHQKANDGNLKLERGYSPHFPEPGTIEDWHWTTQLNQAHAVAFGIERFRSLAPLNTGTIVWQLNDNWPVISWSAVDYDGNRKPAWSAIRHAYAPRLLTLQAGEHGLELVVVNDTDEAVAGEARLRRVDLRGEILASESIDLRAAARTTTRVALPRAITEAGDPADEALFCDLPGAERAVRYFADVREQALEPQALSTEWSLADGVALLTVRATAVVRDLWLAADQLSVGAAVDSGLIQLLPGESHVFSVLGHRAAPGPCEPPAALWSANRLLRSGSADARPSPSVAAVP